MAGRGGRSHAEFGGRAGPRPAELERVLIDAPLVRRLLFAQFPRWADLPLTPVPQSGMDNATFRLGPDLSVRLPRYARWAGQVARQALSSHSGLPFGRTTGM